MVGSAVVGSFSMVLFSQTPESKTRRAKHIEQDGEASTLMCDSRMFYSVPLQDALAPHALGINVFIFAPEAPSSGVWGEGCAP